MNSSRSNGFTRYASAFVAYLLLVILFGAWVRITGSGAGCGSHWPTCNGDVVPMSPSVETIIEYTHRLTSGLLGIFGLVLLVWAWRRFGRGRVAYAAVVTFVYIVIEALIGAGLVLRELVANDDSVARAIVIAIHLVNTLILTAAAGLTAWWSADRRDISLRRHGRLAVMVGIGLVAIIVTSMTGAITALGDTLFPVDPSTGHVIERLQDDLSPAKHFLVRLRVLHPVVAITGAAILLWVSSRVRGAKLDDRSAKMARGLGHAVAAEVVAGVSNIALAAPGWLQLIHLLLAQLVWLAAVMTLAAVAAAAPLDTRSSVQ
jgi:heme A synthase